MAQHASRFAFVALLALTSGCCVFGPPVDVREVREFPEYGGWLPVDSKGAVVPQHVAIEEERDGRVVWRVPTTREEALARVSKERQRTAVLPVHGLFALAGAPLLYAGNLILSITSAYPDPGPDAWQDARAEVAVVDEHGTPIPGALLELCPAALGLPDFLDGAGLRILGEPSIAWWRPTPALIDALNHHLETFLVERRSLEWNSMDFVTMANPGQRRPDSIFVSDREGHTSLHCRVPAARDASDPMVAYVVAWAPGYRPAMQPMTDVTGSCTIALEPEPDREALRQACFQLGEADRSLELCVRGKGLIDPGKLDHDLLDQAAAVLRGLRENSALPSWLRGQAELALTEHLAFRIELYEFAASFWVIPRDRAAGKRVPALKAELERLRAEQHPHTRRLGSPDDDPHAISDEFGRWLVACEQLGMDPDDDPARTERQAELAAQARALLERFERLDAAQPHAEVLRSVLALHEGDLARAVASSRYLDNRRYFAIFYGRLRARDAQSP